MILAVQDFQIVTLIWLVRQYWMFVLMVCSNNIVYDLSLISNIIFFQFQALKETLVILILVGLTSSVNQEPINVYQVSISDLKVNEFSSSQYFPDLWKRVVGSDLFENHWTWINEIIWFISCIQIQWISMKLAVTHFQCAIPDCFAHQLLFAYKVWTLNEIFF